MNTLFFLITNSVKFDMRMLFQGDWTIKRKVKFIASKYILIIKHLFREFRLGEDYVDLSNKRLYYDTKYGIAGYQGMLVRHRKYLKNAGVGQVKVVLDVGANVGYFSLLCREMWPECKIYAFEPVVETYRCLQKNFGNDGLTAVYNCGMSSSAGKARMLFDQSHSAFSQISLHGNVDVELLTLDNFVLDEGVREVDLLKIDTEGYEKFVLAGGKKCLSKTKYIFMEITLSNNENYTISSLISELFSEDFDFQLVQYRNYADRGEGEIPVLDALFINKKLL